MIWNEDDELPRIPRLDANSDGESDCLCLNLSASVRRLPAGERCRLAEWCTRCVVGPRESTDGAHLDLPQPTGQRQVRSDSILTMTETDYRDALRLLDSALQAVGQQDSARTSRLRRRIRALSLQVDLLRARLLQPPARLQRN